MRPEASGNALDLSLIDRPLNQRESGPMDPHMRGTGAGGEPTSETGSSSSAPEPTRKNIPGLGSIYRRGDRWAIEFWKDGVQHRESARTPSEQEAIAHRDKGPSVRTDSDGEHFEGRPAQTSYVPAQWY